MKVLPDLPRFSAIKRYLGPFLVLLVFLTLVAPNILAFNVGVELGQLLALSAILIFMGFWRRTDSFKHQAFAANAVLMTAGFVLMGYQLTGYFTK